jgi:ribose transport system permease protein
VLERFGLLFLLAIVILFFTLDSATPQFATSANAKVLLGSQAILAILAIATIVPLIAHQFDLSVGPNAGLCSVIAAGLMSKSGLPLGPAILAGVALGTLIGAVNGFLVAKVGITSIVATLGTSSVIGAVVLAYTKGQSIVSGISPDLKSFGTDEWLGLPTTFICLLVCAVVMIYLLQLTPWGRGLHGVGANPRAAGLVGLPVARTQMISFVIAGALAGATGVLLLGYQGGGNPQIGSTYTLPALAAAFLGATCIRPGQYNVLGTVIAVYFVGASVNGLTLLGAEAWVSGLFNGLALLVAVTISVVSGRRRRAVGMKRAADDGEPRPPDDDRDAGSLRSSLKAG